AGARVSIAGVDLSVASARLGLRGEMGVLVAASTRSGFANQTERLLLDVAANQATVGLEQARLLGEKRRVASELDERVTRTTGELAAATEQAPLVMDGIPGLFALLTSTGRVDVVNDQMLAYFGLTQEALREWETAGTVHPDDLARVIG